MTWIKMVAVEVDNWLDLRYILKVESIGLGGGTNRDMRKGGIKSLGLKNIKAYPYTDYTKYFTFII